MLDVGANFGWYTLFSLALGCRTVSFEPVPMWRDVLRLGIALNGYGARLYSTGVHSLTSTTATNNLLYYY